MTLAPAPPHARDASHASQTSTPVTTVTAVLVVPAGNAGTARTAAVEDTLDSLARQTRVPERLVVLAHDEVAAAQASDHEGLRGLVPTIRHVAPAPGTPRRDSIGPALAELPAPHTQETGSAPEVEHLWFVTAGSVPAPTALARLLEALRRSPSVAIAGPKLLQRERPRALQAVGIHTTRTGRVIPSPAAGEPDQGQYDRRTDVLAVPFEGMLVERELFERLGGHDPAFGALGGDLDLCWRAQQAGRRVIVVPRASLHVPTDDTGTSAESPALHRRQARRVALTRCSLVAAPFLALWISVTALLGGLGLLVLKRPRAAWAELADLPSVLDPWRTVAARWRSRGTRTVRRKDLRGVFVTRRAVLRHAGDLVHDHVGLDAEPREDLLQPTAALESGPVADEAQDLNLMAASWAARAARNPGFLAVLLATAVSVAAGRHVGGSLGRRLDAGLAGGELLGTRADAGALWHSWLDGWHGSGLGFAGEQSPHLAVLAGLAWVVEHFPGITAPDSPAGAVVATLVGAALPLATLTAYLAGRVVTHSRWPRALAALAWASTSVLATAVGAGRLGALVAAILLPLVAAGFALAARRTGSTTATAATVVATAVLASFMPAMLAATTVSALVLVVLGRGAGPRLRGLALLVLPAALLGPWLPTLLRDPYLLLAGPGLTVWGGRAAEPWELALLDPSGTPLRAIVAAPLVLAGVLGLLRAGRRSAAATSLMVTALAGLALALAAPRVVLGATPQGTPHPSSPITAWPGTGLLLYALALLAAALLGAAGLPIGRSAGGWRATTRWPVAALVVASVALSAGWISWKTVGADLRAWAGPRPAVAIDQGHGPLANRMLVLQPVKGVIRYELLGREVSGVARDLPLPGADRPDGDALAAAVAGIFAPAGSTESQHAADSLVDQGVGFVGIRTAAADPALRTLDATAGLSRLGEHDGVLFWRVLPPAQPKGQPEPVGPSRVRVVTPDGATGVPVTGDHSRLSATLPARDGASLVVAEPQDWLAHARVAVDGQVLQPKPGTSQPTFVLPRAGGHLTVEVLPTEEAWRWAQGGLLALLAFLAIPIGRRRERRAS